MRRRRIHRKPAPDPAPVAPREEPGEVSLRILLAINDESWSMTLAQIRSLPDTGSWAR